MPRRRSSRAPVSTRVDPIDSDKDVTRRQALELWRASANRERGSRARAKDAEDLVLGVTKLVPPRYLTRRDSAIADLIPTLPARKTLLLNMINMVADNRPVVERHRPPKGGPATEGRAEETETALNALLKDLFPWDKPRDSSCGRSVAHGQFAIVTLLAEDVWDAQPEAMDVISKAEYDALPKAKRAGFHASKEKAADGTLKDGDTYERMKVVYWRDGNGKGVEDDDYGRRDHTKTHQAYQDTLDDHMASHPPFSIRGYSIFDTAPVHGADGLEALCIRQLMEPDQLLLTGYRCQGLSEGADGKARVLLPTGYDAQLWGQGGKIFLYQFFIKIKGDPCVMYLVGGQDTTIAGDDGEQVAAITNLREKWGFSRLPCGYYFGLNLPTDNPDDSGVPLSEPLEGYIKAYEGLLGSTIITAWRRGTSKYLVVPNPNIPPQAYLDGANNLKPLDMDRDNDVVIGYGPVSHLAPLETSVDTKWASEQLSVGIHEASPDPAASGGPADSGRQAALAHTYAQSATRMIPEGLRQAYEDAASMLLEWACCFMRKKQMTEIPIYANVEAEPQEGETSGGPQTIMVRLKEAWIGKNYRVSAKYLPSPNPIDTQQKADLYGLGLTTFEAVQEAMGKTNSLRERIKIVDDLFWKSERGMMELNAIDARMRGDVERAKAYEAWLAQQATPLAVGPDGKPIQMGPSAALDQAFQGPAAAPPGAGAGGPTGAQAALAGTIGAGRGAEQGDMMATAGAPAPAGIAPSNGTGGMA